MSQTASIASRGKDRIELFDLDIGETANLLEKKQLKTNEPHGLLQGLLDRGECRHRKKTPQRRQAALNGALVLNDANHLGACRFLALVPSE